MSEENETDTFISVDIELSRVAINCSVCECAGWKGRVVGLKFTFQSSSLSSILFLPPKEVLSAAVLKVKYLQLTNSKRRLRQETHKAGRQ